MINTNELYAKPNKKLLDHLVETGCVAEALLTMGRGVNAVKNLSAKLHIPDTDLVSFITWLCAVHDIGKAHPEFQLYLSVAEDGEITSAVSKLSESGEIDVKHDPEKHIRHERYSMEIINSFLIRTLGVSRAFASMCSSLIAYHHQGKGKDALLGEPVYKYKEKNERWNDWAEVQNNLLHTINEIWPFPKDIEFELETPFSFVYGINGLTYFALSVMVVSDWITSGSDWATLLQTQPDPKTCAQTFVQSHQLTHKPLKEYLNGLSWEDVFPFEKNELQKTVGEHVSSETRFLLIEAPCGYGKTEAAMLAASKMGSDKSGVYFAMPTTSTAKGLTPRMQTVMNKIEPSIVIPELDSSMIWNEKTDMNSIPKNLWTSRTRHQFLYPFAVGTIDQALKSVLYYRYSCIGMLGLTDKVLVIDEVHAYDAYMLTELTALIKWCRFFNVPVILLSATLPVTVKKELFEAAGLRTEPNLVFSAYPLISMVNHKNLIQIPFQIEGKTVPVKCEHTDDLIETMVNKASSINEGCAAIILDTVDHAFEVYDKLKEKTDDLFIYVGRSTLSSKAAKSEELLKLLGKDRSNRPKRLLVVTTSIIEQSLDIDFDYMFTTIAPIDLLIQRIGRVWRHSDVGTIREKVSIDTPVTVVIPEDYNGLTWIYSDAKLLDNTAEMLQKFPVIDTVKTIRTLIDTVYTHDNLAFLRRKNYERKMSAGRVILDWPTNNASMLSKSEEDYRKFDATIPKTRESDYDTETVCILPELRDDFSYSDKIRIFQENVVTGVGANKLSAFSSLAVETDIEWLSDMIVFVDPFLTVATKDITMQLTPDGLKFRFT